MRFNGRMVAAVLTGVLVAGGTAGGYFLTAGSAKADNAGTCTALWAGGGVCEVDQTVTSVQDISLQFAAQGIPKGVNFNTSVDWSTTCDGVTNANSQELTLPQTLHIFTGFARSCSVTAKVTLRVNSKMPSPLTTAPGIQMQVNFTQGSPSSAPSPSPSGGGSSGSGISGAIKGFAGKCLDDAGNSSSVRAKVQIWSCNHGKGQQWTYAGGEVKHNGLCLNAKGGGASGSKVILWGCNSAANEIWVFNTLNHEVLLRAHGFSQCLTDPGSSTRNGTQLVVSACKNGASQHWSLPGH